MGERKISAGSDSEDEDRKANGGPETLAFKTEARCVARLLNEVCGAEGDFVCEGVVFRIGGELRLEVVVPDPVGTDGDEGVVPTLPRLPRRYRELTPSERSDEGSEALPRLWEEWWDGDLIDPEIEVGRVMHLSELVWSWPEIDTVR